MNFDRNTMNRISQIKNSLKGKNPEDIINENPQLKEFVEKNKNKSLSQIASEFGIDPWLINLLK